MQVEIQSSAVARFFSATVLKELAGSGRSPTLARLIKESGMNLDEFSQDKLSVLFDRAFDLLKFKLNRHEYVYKAALTQKVLLGIHSLNTASMLTEFRVGPCKADVVILNGTGTVYEIKSERDSLTRLEEQITAYSKVFAKVNIIVGANHLKAAMAAVPDYVGVMVLSDRYQVTTMRYAIDDASRTSSDAIFEALTQREAASILKLAGIEIPKVPNTQSYQALRNLFVDLDAGFAHESMVEVLKKTRNLLPLEALLNELPESLHTVAIASKLRSKDQSRLVETLQTPIYKAMCWG